MADISAEINEDGESLTTLRLAEGVTVFSEKQNKWKNKTNEKTFKQSELRKSESWFENIQRKDEIHNKLYRQLNRTNLKK